MKRSKLWLGSFGRTYTWNETRETAIRLILSIKNKQDNKEDWFTATDRLSDLRRVWEFTREDAKVWRHAGLDAAASAIFPKWLYDYQASELYHPKGTTPTNAVTFTCTVMYRMLTGRLPQQNEELWSIEEEETIGEFKTTFIEAGLTLFGISEKDINLMLTSILKMLLTNEELAKDNSACTFCPDVEFSDVEKEMLKEMDEDIKGLTMFIDEFDLVPVDDATAVKKEEAKEEEHQPNLPKSTNIEDVKKWLEKRRTMMKEEDDDEKKKEESENNDDDEPDLDDLFSSSDSSGRPGCSIEFRKAKKGERGFEDVAGMDELKQKLQDEVLFVLKSPELAKVYKLHAANGMILYGPPGCGKTFIAEKFAVESGMKFALIKGSDLGCTYIHGSQTMIADLFQKAERNAPCVLCFDEIDALLPRRSKSDGSGGDSCISSEVNEMLSQLNNCNERGIFVIGTTNEPENIDPAIMRAGRLEELVYVPLPDLATRRLLFTKALEGRPVADDIDIEVLATSAEGYVSSDISLMADRAALRAAKRCELITMADLMEVIGKTRRSIAAEDMKRYQRMRLRIENNDRRCAGQFPRIGFAATACRDEIR